MAAMLETPSRIWRRIEAIEDRDMPSLPSLPPFEDSADADDVGQDELDDDMNHISSPMHSTPAAASANRTAASTVRATSSTSSTARFASSIASRSSKSSLGFSSSRGMSARIHPDSFDASMIPSHQIINADPGASHSSSDDNIGEQSMESIPEVYLPPEGDYDERDGEQDVSLTEALQSISRTSSPQYPSESFENEPTPKKNYDYSISLRSEPKPSPFDKYRNVALRKTSTRIRTPSLSRTSSSQTSSPANSTPQSSRSIILPGSADDSPTSVSPTPLPPSSAPNVPHYSTDEPPYSDEDLGAPMHETGVRSMDITDVHVSPPQLDHGSSSEDGEPHSQGGEPYIRVEQDVDGSQSEREPTFSSDGGPTPFPQSHRDSNQTTHLSAPNLSSASSPAQSVAFTPTPAFPRPRARFNLPSSNDLLDTQDHDQEHEPLTPHTRRRSFLLSVINSTTRPRLKFPTPHPRNNYLGTPSIAESTPSGPSSTVARTTLQTAFAGVTPRPRAGLAKNPRASHPLAQTLSSPGTSGSESVSPVVSVPASGAKSARGVTGQWATPASYDGMGDRASFISTASSHDLTTHHRVNTSFDPTMGFGAGMPGHGVGRFNAGKLNNYLHGLNRRLQEENEALVERLKKAEERKVESGSSFGAGVGVGNGSEGRRRSSGGGRRVSAGGTTLGNVEEDVGGEGWVEEKAELEDIVEAYKEEVAKCLGEKDEVERALEEEREQMNRDKERWRERMADVEQGVEVIIKELEKKVETAEGRAKDVEKNGLERVRMMEKKMVEYEGERDMAMERAEKAERVLESGKELGGELREANERIGKIMGDLRNANAQIKELEEEVMRSDARIDDLEKDLRDDRDFLAGLDKELNTKANELAADRAQIRQMEEAARQADEVLHATKVYVAELEEDARSVVERMECLEDELASANSKVQAMIIAQEEGHVKMEKLEADAQKAQELARQMEEALEEAEKKMRADEEALAELRIKAASIERGQQRESINMTQEPSRDSSANVGPTDADLEALETELDNANREIGRLTTVLNQSPARRAMDKARDTKIELLEREKEELLERNKALRMAVAETNAPSKIINASGISPIHRQVLSLSIRAPRTPGGPLRDMSWLNNTTADPTVSPLIAEIARLQRQLDQANESIDDKLDKLEDAGLGVVGLTKKLEDARSNISALEEEIARLSRKEERRVRRLERARCQKCLAKFDFLSSARADESLLEISQDNLPTEPPTPPTKSSEALRANLQSVNAHLETMKVEWEDEKMQLLGEKAILQDATSCLNVQVRNAKEEARRVAESERAGEKIRAGTQGELDKARRAINDLETNLKSERAELRVLTTERDRIHREKTNILAQLQRTESDMEDVKHQLHKCKQENHDLETELRENANADQKARLLEVRVTENMETIDQLRQERSLLSGDHKELQRRFSQISEQANRLRDEYTASSTSHDNRRHQLDLCLLEIDDLRRALSGQAGELQKVEMEKDRISAERTDVARTVAALEADLARVKRDAEAFGHDLKLLRAEKENQESKHTDELFRMERSRKQTEARIRLLNEQLESQREKTGRAREELKSHVCAIGEQQLSAIKLQHSKECKGLIVQIRYLKAKFTRESSLRGDLGYQKRYLLVLLSRYEKSEQTVFASIARIGFPLSVPPAVKKEPKLKSVVLALVFLSRAKRASDLWREHGSSKHAVTAALEDVRRRRAIA